MLYKINEGDIVCPGGSAQFSKGEKAVFLMTAMGHSGKSAAKELGLKEKTIATYRSRIKRKCGVSSVAEIVQYAIYYRYLIPTT